MSGQASEPSAAERAKAALRARDGRAALDWLSRIEPAQADADTFLDKALALRMLGDLGSAVAALDGALALEPKHFLALLSKGALLERLGRAKQAAATYRNALTVAPPDDVLPPSLAAPVERARQAVRLNTDALADHLRASLTELRESFRGEPLDRFDESLEIFSGRTRAYVQEPLLLNYPCLPAIAFHDRRDFPWLAELEAATADIAEEYQAVAEVRAGEFAPYIAYPPGAPVNQWGELNHSPRWSSFFLWRDGVRQDGACAACPRTAALLARLPMADQPGFAPTAMFSVLEARTRIPPHTGSANTRLIVHLPLVLPGPAAFRVGNVTRPWRMGEAWLFDDTIEHEAWNDADAARAILILDIWNPLLSPAERTLVSAMMTAANAFKATD
ncbi:MAG: aspartyl/asparaginyl beta-hydroxylase domain-containing protein [Caulobacteraceae bacterium]